MHYEYVKKAKASTLNLLFATSPQSTIYVDTDNYLGRVGTLIIVDDNSAPFG